GAVAAQEVFDAGDVEAGAGCEAVAGVPHGLEAVAADEGDAVGAGFGDLAVEAVGDGVDGVLRHDAVGGVLAARDEDEPGDGVGDDVFAGQLRGLFGLAGEQGAEARVDALHGVGGEGRGEDSVDLVQDVFDVGLRGGGVGLVEVPGGVGGADDPVPAPGDHEEHGLVGAEEDPGRGVDAVLGHDEVDALGRPDVDLSAAADEFLDVVGPDAGGVDDLLGADLAGRVALEVADAQPG